MLATKQLTLFRKSVESVRDKAATLAAAFELSRRILSQPKWLSNKKILHLRILQKYLFPF